MSVLLTKYCYGDQNEGDEIGEACSTYRKMRGHTAFWMEILKEKSHMGGPRIDERIILKLIFME